MDDYEGFDMADINSQDDGLDSDNDNFIHNTEY